MTHFTIFLASNASMDVFPQNKAYEFRNRLAEEIVFSNANEWEVSLSSIIYPNNYSQLQALASGKEPIRLEVQYIEGQDRIKGGFQFETRIKRNNETIAETLNNLDKSLEIAAGFNYKYLFTFVNYQGYTELRKKLPSGISNNLTKIRLSPANQNGLTFLRQLGFVNLPQSLSNVVIRKSVFISAGDISSSPAQLQTQLPTIFLYSNIASYQFIGNISAPLLNTVPVRTQNHGSGNAIVSEEFATQTYINVAETQIREILISLRNDQGEHIVFGDGKVFVKLDFRRKRHRKEESIFNPSSLMGGERSFYLWLASNSSTDVFPANIAANFRNALSIPLIFASGSRWEVALSDISYPADSLNITKIRTKFDIQYTYSESGNKQILSYGSAKDFVTFAEYIVAMNSDFERGHQTQNKANKIPLLNFKMDWSTKRLTFSANIIDGMENIRLSINDQEMLDHFILLGFAQLATKPRAEIDKHLEGDFPVSVLLPITAASAPSVNLQAPALFIYCDAIDYQLVADTYAPLLHTVPTAGAIADSMISHTPQKRTYVSVSKAYINEIGLSIRNDSGEIAHLSNGKTVVKLHFQISKSGLDY